MNTTALPSEQYICRAALPNIILASFRVVSEEPMQGTTTETPRESMLIGPEVRFDAEEYDFDDLVSKLVRFERESGVSSLEMFSRYVHGELELSSDTEEWIDLFMLYLGANEVRQYSCP